MKNIVSVFQNPGTINCDVLWADIPNCRQYLTCCFVPCHPDQTKAYTYTPSTPC
jgi:hypothetical protein